MNATAYAFLSWQRPAVLLINEYECVDPDYPLHIPTNNFLDGNSRLTDCNFTIRMLYYDPDYPLHIMMFIYFYIAKPTYCFILMYICGLTVVIKRICVMLCCVTVTKSAESGENESSDLYQLVVENAKSNQVQLYHHHRQSFAP